MKKGLKKKSTMITLIIVSLVLVALYVVMLARPVAVGFNYTHKTDSVTTTYNFGFKKVTTTRESGNSKTTREVYYYCKDGLVVIDTLGTVSNNDEYKTWKKNIEENWGAYKNTGIEINAFKFGEDGDYSCSGSIIFAVVGGVVVVGMLALTALSIFGQNNKKKRRK